MCGRRAGTSQEAGQTRVSVIGCCDVLRPSLLSFEKVSKRRLFSLQGAGSDRVRWRGQKGEGREEIT